MVRSVKHLCLLLIFMIMCSNVALAAKWVPIWSDAEERVLVEWDSATRDRVNSRYYYMVWLRYEYINEKDNARIRNKLAEAMPDKDWSDYAYLVRKCEYYEKDGAANCECSYQGWYESDGTVIHKIQAPSGQAWREVIVPGSHEEEIFMAVKKIWK